MKLAAAVGLLLIGAACGSTGAAAVSPSASSIESLPPSASPSPPASSSPPASVAFACRLPVVTQGRPQYGWSGGFITFPAAAYTSDPNGVINAIGDGELATQAQPTLMGYAVGWPFYDLRARRWLPAAAGQAAGDGSSYAFAEPSFGGSQEPIDVVTVATGGDHRLKIDLPGPGVGQFWQIGDYDGRYVYLVAEQIDQFPAGVWRLDPPNGALAQLLQKTAGSVLLVENGTAWVGLNNPTDPSPPRPAKGQAFDTIASIKLATGAQTTWIYRPGQSVVFWGLDSSERPLVMVTSGPEFSAMLPLVLVDSPGTNGIAIPAGFLPLGAVEADTGALWFGGPDGIYYWTLATGFLKVYSFQADPSQQEMILPAGHCV
jgi:hypothetical protein